MSLESTGFTDQLARFDGNFDDDGSAPLAIAAGLIATPVAGLEVALAR